MKNKIKGAKNETYKVQSIFKNTSEMVTVGTMDWDYEGNLLCLNYPKGKDYFGYEDDIALMQ